MLRDKIVADLGEGKYRDAGVHAGSGRVRAADNAASADGVPGDDRCCGNCAEGRRTGYHALTPTERLNSVQFDTEIIRCGANGAGRSAHVLGCRDDWTPISAQEEAP